MARITAGCTLISDVPTPLVSEVRSTGYIQIAALIYAGLKECKLDLSDAFPSSISAVLII